MSTSIEWTDETWNPVVGCSPVSDGCQNCFAARMAKRQVAMGNQNYVGTVDDRGRWTGQVNFAESALEKPLGWRKPRRIFVNSMSDLFHENVPDAWVDMIFEVIERCPQHTFQVLTKRPVRAWTGPDNIHVYTSISNQLDCNNYGHHILEVRATIRGISYEPALGPVNWDAILSSGRIGHVICGGESGPGYRHMPFNRAREARDACQKHGVPFFLKQFAGSKGRILDGRTWDEMPEGVPL